MRDWGISGLSQVVSGRLGEEHLSNLKKDTHGHQELCFLQGQAPWLEIYVEHLGTTLDLGIMPF